MPNPIDYKTEGVVFDIQRYSIHDGPGIRTNVFLKGCPLSCLWCSNPESQQLKPTLMYDTASCIHCGVCVRTCKQEALSLESDHIVNYDKCISCGECVSMCPSGALTLKGHKMTVEAVIKELKKDATTYRASDGGITLSGGEPLVQWKFSSELLKACKAQGWHTAIETTGYGSEAAIEAVIPYVDQVLLDCKSTNDEIHKKFTGVTFEKIRENSKRISELGYTVIRVPTIPEVNASEAEIENICKHAKSLHGVGVIHLLPYHIYGLNKYKQMGRTYRMPDHIKPLEPEDLTDYKKIVEKNGFRCIIGG